MKEFVITEKDAGSRLDKQLHKILGNCGSGFIYKMLRKKNITLNGSKAEGNEHLITGDVIRIYFSDETFDKLAGSKTFMMTGVSKGYRADKLIVHEDEDIIILNKPAGLLSQKASDADVSVNELCIGYLLDKNEITDDSLMMFRPSICNRLDRNTSGLIIFAKNYPAAAAVSEMLKYRTVHKYYKCLVKGHIENSERIDGYILKNKASNKVEIFREPKDGAYKIITSYVPLEANEEYTLLEVELITGKSHQIRAHLSSIGHPIIGDHKYGDRSVNLFFKDRFGIDHQMLHAYKLVMPSMSDGCLCKLSEGEFEAPLPDDFKSLLKYCSFS